ncbi:MAG: helix-turn-helix domain-containing protein, partial [Acetoanaerobium sp.]|nr:helix-turn-helix domain-containing protein [Acetoanaerobium sp.]
MSDEKYIMSSLSNALDILDLLSKRDNIGVMDISKALGISKSS